MASRSRPSNSRHPECRPPQTTTRQKARTSRRGPGPGSAASPGPIGAAHDSPGQRPGGERPISSLRPERAVQEVPRCGLAKRRASSGLRHRSVARPCFALSGRIGGGEMRPIPRALPWAVMSCPFGAEENGRDILVSHREPRHSSLLSGPCTGRFSWVRTSSLPASPVLPGPAAVRPAVAPAWARAVSRWHSESRVSWARRS